MASHYFYLITNDSDTSVEQDEVVQYSKTYSYDGSGRLISESITKILHSGVTLSSEIVFLYDEGSMIGMQYTSPISETSIYYYFRNLQGDVIGIYDTNGNKVVEYAYDAWGNCTTKSTTTNYTVAHVNPIRYRGYYYDEDTKLYYLNSRYYNPEWRRFISPDDTAYIDPENPIGLNLYAYCENNPVMGYDPFGTFDLWEFLRGAGNIITGALAIVAGAIVLIGGAELWMLIAAGITLVAGVLTLNNGIADTIGSLTGYNYMADGLFNGNTTAYNWYSGVTGTVATIGTAICGNYIRKEYFMRGATPGTEGKMTLEPGMELDRYGADYGRYLTNTGTHYSKLKLPPSNNLILTHYKVLKPFNVSTGIVKGGGGFQYFTWRSVKRLVQLGYLVAI